MTGKSILIVDDEAPIREMIAVALEMAGYECLEADNSKDAHALIVDRCENVVCDASDAGGRGRSGPVCAVTW